MSILSGALGLAEAVLYLTGSGSHHTTILTTLTSRPLFTLGAILLGVGYLAVLLTSYDWMGMNVVGLLLIPPAIATYSRTALPLLVGLLILTAILDYIAVHRSTMMQSLAKNSLQFRYPVAFIALTTAESLSKATKNELQGIRLLGLGDVAVPGLFIVALAGTYSLVSLPVILAVAGYVSGYWALVADPFDLHAYAGLPFLNGGVLIGYALSIPVS